MVVSIFSTVILEALALGVVPLICSIGALPKYEPDIASNGAAIEVRSISEAKDLIEEVIANPVKLDWVRENIHNIAGEYFLPGPADEKIASRILAKINQG
jgi:glycosyltransferase involved in cell wall biosynthesis